MEAFVGHVDCLTPVQVLRPRQGVPGFSALLAPGKQSTRPPQASVLNRGTIGTRDRSLSRRVLSRRLRWLGPPFRPPPSHLSRLRHAARQRSAPRAAARPKPPPPRRAPCLLAKSFRRAPPPHLAWSPPEAAAPASFVVGARRKLLAQARRPPRRVAVVVRAGRRTGGYPSESPEPSRVEWCW